MYMLHTKSLNIQTLYLTCTNIKAKQERKQSLKSGHKSIHQEKVRPSLTISKSGKPVHIVHCLQYSRDASLINDY